MVFKNDIDYKPRAYQHEEYQKERLFPEKNQARQEKRSRKGQKRTSGKHHCRIGTVAVEKSPGIVIGKNPALALNEKEAFKLEVEIGCPEKKCKQGQKEQRNKKVEVF